MTLLIELLIVLVVLAIIGGAAYFIVQKFQLPQFVLWIVGAILLIGLLLYAARLMEGGPAFFTGKMH